jgi:RHS repeat-associated protein
MTYDGIHHYSYDAEGNILTVDNGATAAYVYDANNRRVNVTTASGTYDYVYDFMGRRVSEWSPSSGHVGAPLGGRVYWGSQQQQVAFVSGSGATYFDHQDYLGTERMRTDSTGAVAATYLSGPWGDGYIANINETAADQDSLHFAGLDFDKESGTQHAQFRNYSSAQGRWLAADPYDGSYDLTNPQSLNRYAYVLNNPLSFIDPLGLEIFDCITTNYYVDGEFDSSSTECFDTGGGGYGGGGVSGGGGGGGGGAGAGAPNNAPTVAAPSPGVCTAAGAVAGARAGALIGEGLGA